MAKAEAPCPIDGCRLVMNQGRMMCHRHWDSVSLPLQRMVIRLFNNGAPIDGFDEARDNAVSQVNEAVANRPRRPPYQARQEKDKNEN